MEAGRRRDRLRSKDRKEDWILDLQDWQKELRNKEFCWRKDWNSRGWEGEIWLEGRAIWRERVWKYLVCRLNERFE
jgi:hypothetical protein